MLAETSAVTIEAKICMVRNLSDIMMYSKFQDVIFRATIYRGSNFPFLIDFCMGLTTVQRSCAAFNL